MFIPSPLEIYIWFLDKYWYFWSVSFICIFSSETVLWKCCHLIVLIILSANILYWIWKMSRQNSEHVRLLCASHFPKCFTYLTTSSSHNNVINYRWGKCADEEIEAEVKWAAVSISIKVRIPDLFPEPILPLKKHKWSFWISD